MAAISTRNCVCPAAVRVRSVRITVQPVSSAVTPLSSGQALIDARQPVPPVSTITAESVLPVPAIVCHVMHQTVFNVPVAILWMPREPAYRVVATWFPTMVSVRVTQPV